MDSGRRAAVEIHGGLHKELKKLAVLDDLKIYVLINAILEGAVKNQELMKVLIGKLRLMKNANSQN